MKRISFWRHSTLFLLGLWTGFVSDSTVYAETESRVGGEVIQVSSNFPKGYQGVLKAFLKKDSELDLENFHYQDNQGMDRLYTMEEIKKGIVLVHALNKDLIVLRGKEFDSHAGGRVHLMFYRDFFGNDRRELQFLYQPEGSDWVVRTDDPQGRDTFNQVSLQIRTSLGAPTGVSSIALNLQQSPVRKYNPTDLPRASQRAFLFLD